MSDGSLMIFFERPISGTIMWIAIVLFLLPLIKIYRTKITKTRTDMIVNPIKHGGYI